MATGAENRRFKPEQERNAYAIQDAIANATIDPGNDSGISYEFSMLQGTYAISLIARVNPAVRQNELGKLLQVRCELRDTTHVLIGRRTYYFDYTDETHERIHVIAGVKILENGEQGKGFGFGLVLGTDAVIQKTLAAFPGIFSGKEVVAELVDSSSVEEQPPDRRIARKGWTSKVIRDYLTGFAPAGQDTLGPAFRKTYQTTI